MVGTLTTPEAIPGFPEFGHIPFEGLHNTRDLGGLPAADGRRIKPALLLRSGALHKATEEDLARLLADYHLEGVVDFRTELERDKEPDPRELMEGVVFYDLPALAGETMGITHGAGLAKDMKALEAVSAQPHEMVKKMYPRILLGDAGRVAYRSLLNVLLESDGGAVLWHCSEGKDRAGLGAVVVERALGVPEPDVRADYLATNLFARTRAEGILDALAAKLPALRGLDADIDSFFYAYADYYDAAMDAVGDAFGTFDAYLAEALDFGPEKQAALRAKYLH
ncbi:tyrosine-protein phosphatase [Adlercreutzia sp. R7]|uniref:Tyrosine-protein phosphatase n=1 Tax=Adlercreutzia wanghongyangiae TaxID=3111451 RepID=A0ABU6IKU6_9ACTN|nr:tyrosine-protein phosphatase [Adlercreutzia sp. R7]